MEKQYQPEYKGGEGRSRSQSSSTVSSKTEAASIEPLKTEKTNGSIKNLQRDPEQDLDIALEPIATVKTNHTARSSVIERNYSHPVSELNHGIVGWDDQDDPENPRNWTMRRKAFILGLVSAITFISPLASSMFAPGVTFMNIEFHNTNSELTSLVVSIYVLGWAIGPLFLSPLSEIYGRRRILDAANAFFTVWQIGCALAQNIETLIICRLLAGIGGSGCLVLGGGVITDLFAPEQRGAATAAYSLGPLFGPVVGPIAGGFLAQRAGWRWVYWVLFASSGALTILLFFVNEETHPHILLQRKVDRLKKETGNPDLISWYDRDRTGPKPTPAQTLKHGLVRPMKLLFRSPITAIMSTYMATVYGTMYLLFTSLTLVYATQYAWEPEMTGLAYLGIGFGFFAGLAIQAVISDKTLMKLAERNGGVAEPEMRLPACTFFAMFLPVSLFWYGWAAEKQVHWIVPIVGLIPMGIGMMGIFVPIQTYMLDTFPEYAASAIAALTVTRSMLGAFLPLAGPKMYANLGLGWGNSLLGFIALTMGLAIFWLWKNGKWIREKYPVQL